MRHDKITSVREGEIGLASTEIGAVAKGHYSAPKLTVFKSVDELPAAARLAIEVALRKRRAQ